MQALIKNFNTEAILSDILEVLNLEGRNLLVMPTSMQNTLRNSLPDVEFGNLANEAFRRTIGTAKSSALAPSVTEQGVRLQDWDRILFVECTFNAKRANSEIGFTSPASRTLLNALSPRVGRVSPECHIYSELNLGDVVEALGNLKQTQYPQLDIEISTLV